MIASGVADMRGKGHLRFRVTAAWDPKYASWLELAEACDVPVRWSCRTGVCHTCMTGLIAGSISYDPEPLERPAPGNVLVCCSQTNRGCYCGTVREMRGVQSCVLILCLEVFSPTTSCPITRKQCASSASYRARIR